MPIRSTLVLVLLASASAAQVIDIDHTGHLPPTLAWDGESARLMLAPDHEWATQFEISGGSESPDYVNTVDYLRRLVEAAPELEMVSLGDSPQGRPLWAVIASSEAAFTWPALHDSERPTVLAHSGIHSGEIDGKDASMMLLRDLTVLGTQRELLDRVNFVFVPIFSVDAHERRGRYSRMNQHGPTVQGWRTNARNLNLNRDYTKADTVEMQHMLAAINAIDPDLYIDLHVTDGADYQYDITHGSNATHGWSPAINAWLDGRYRDFVNAELERFGHVPGPLIFLVDGNDTSKGMYSWTAGPRFSNGYGDARHLPTILVENHSLKPYKQRVLGTYVYLQAALFTVGEWSNELRAATKTDRDARPSTVHLNYERGPDPLGTIEFKAIRSETFESPISGDTVVRWLGEPYMIEIPVVGNGKRTAFVERPKAYWIPAEWNRFADLLELHGIEFETITSARSIKVERWRYPDAAIATDVFEGHVRVNPGEGFAEVSTVEFGPGSLRVVTDQPLGTLAMLLLEAGSPDGVFQWGLMLEVLQRAEYFEAYMMEPMAEQMMSENPTLAAEFEQRLEADQEFADDPSARLEFFYARTPYYDQTWKRYPIAREMN